MEPNHEAYAELSDEQLSAMADDAFLELEKAEATPKVTSPTTTAQPALPAPRAPEPRRPR